MLVEKNWDCVDLFKRRKREREKVFDDDLS